MEQQKGFIGVGIIILALILLGTTGYFAYQNMQLKNQVVPTPTTTPAPAPTSTAITKEETANWKTYTNNKYSISFKYPADYFHYISPWEDTVYLAPSSGSDVAYGSPMGLGKNDVWLSVNTNEFDFDTSLEQFLALPEKFYYKNAKKEKTTIANRIGYKITIDTPLGPQAVVSYEGIVKNKKTIYRIKLDAFTLEALLAQKAVFDQILSTLKFTE